MTQARPAAHYRAGARHFAHDIVAAALPGQRRAVQTFHSHLSLFSDFARFG